MSHIIAFKLATVSPPCGGSAGIPAIVSHGLTPEATGFRPLRGLAMRPPRSPEKNRHEPAQRHPLRSAQWLCALWLTTTAAGWCGGVENGGFESWEKGQPTGWLVTNQTGVAEERQGMHGGQACLRFDVTAARNFAEVLPVVRIPADFAKVYRLTFFYRQDPGCTVLADLRSFDAAGKASGDVPLYHWREPAATWSEVLIKFVPPPDAREMQVRLYAVGNGKVWVDDLVFAEDGAKPPGSAGSGELLQNPGFEGYSEEESFGNRMSDGQWRPNAPIRATIVRNPQKAHSGRNCLFIEQESEGQGAMYQSGLGVDFLKLYHVRFWARGDGDLNLMVYQFPWPTVSIGGKIELTPEWKQYEMTYQPSSNLVTRVGLAWHFIGELWLDDTSLQAQ